MNEKRVKIWLCFLLLATTILPSHLIAQPSWFVYNLSYEAQIAEGSANTFQKTVDAFVDRGMISPEMEPKARAKAQHQHDAWVKGFTVRGEAAVMSTGAELSYSFPAAGVPIHHHKGYDWHEGRLKAIGSKYEVDYVSGDYPTSSPLAWLFLGGKLNSDFVEVTRDPVTRKIVFERLSTDKQYTGVLVGTIERIEVEYIDSELLKWSGGREWTILPNGQVMDGKTWSTVGDFGEPGYVATARLFDGNGDNWRTYKFEFVRTDSAGFSPESIPIGTMITDHRTPDGQPSLRYEWDGTFADVSQHAGGGFPVAGWYVLSALGFAALGVYFWRKR